MPPVGITSGRTSREPNATSSAVATDSSDEIQKTVGSDAPKPSMRSPASTGPTANPIGPDAPKIAIVMPRRGLGVTSRIPASITPVLPSWNPMSSIDSASCHGSFDRATPAKTTASTRALRMMMALRLYLSAQTPQNGTSGNPTTKINALNSPMNPSRSASGTPIWLQVGRQQGEDLADPEPLDHRGDPEDGDEDAPVLDGSCREGGCGRGRRAGVGHRGSLADAAADAAGPAAHTKAPEGTGGSDRSTGPLAPNKSGVLGRRRVPRSLALRPSNLVPGTVPGIAPLAGLAVRTCPFGQDEMYGRGPRATTALSTNFR